VATTAPRSTRAITVAVETPRSLQVQVRRQGLPGRAPHSR
jgi:hypothetical protein